jgi:hypothetical protein
MDPYDKADFVNDYLSQYDLMLDDCGEIVPYKEEG